MKLFFVTVTLAVTLVVTLLTAVMLSAPASADPIGAPIPEKPYTDCNSALENLQDKADRLTNYPARDDRPGTTPYWAVQAEYVEAKAAVTASCKSMCEAPQVHLPTR